MMDGHHSSRMGKGAAHVHSRSAAGEGVSEDPWDPGRTWVPAQHGQFAASWRASFRVDTIATEACPGSREGVKTRSCWKKRKERRQGLKRMPVTWGNATEREAGSQSSLQEWRSEMIIRSCQAPPRMSFTLRNFQGSLLATPESSSNA